MRLGIIGPFLFDIDSGIESIDTRIYMMPLVGRNKGRNKSQKLGARES
jgi:hypothetical protein